MAASSTPPASGRDDKVAASDLLRTQLQETGSIPTGGSFDLPWLLLLLSDLGIDENRVHIDVVNGRIEVVQ